MSHGTSVVKKDAQLTCPEWTYQWFDRGSCDQRKLQLLYQVFLTPTCVQGWSIGLQKLRTHEIVVSHSSSQTDANLPEVSLVSDMVGTRAIVTLYSLLTGASLQALSLISGQNQRARPCTSIIWLTLKLFSIYLSRHFWSLIMFPILQNETNISIKLYH